MAIDEEKSASSLFRYRRFCLDEIKSTLVEKTIKMSNPLSFNDPWDCIPHFDFSVLDSLAGQRRFAHFLREATKKHHGVVSYENRIHLNKIRWNKQFAIKMFKEVVDEIRRDLVGNYYVCCFSSQCTSALMWSHYADGHQGICYEFSWNEMPFKAALEVKYQDTYPIFDLFPRNREDKIVGNEHMTMLTKASNWSYESEYRIISPADKISNSMMPYIVNGHLRIENCLISIIIGCSMPSKNADEILGMVKKYAPMTIVRRAEKLPNQYGLSIRTIYSG